MKRLFCAFGLFLPLPLSKRGLRKGFRFEKWYILVDFHNL